MQRILTARSPPMLASTALGQHRRAEAERLVKLREAAAAARKKKGRDPRCTGPYISCE